MKRPKHNTQPALAFDHIAVTAPDLETGIAYVRERLGVTVPFGGRHKQMGTHNCLMRLGTDEFLEIIAIDPAAEKPDHPRWFDLDMSRHSPPRLGNWVLRSPDIHETLRGFPPSLGAPTALTRGELNWLISVPDDGAMPFGGGFPTVIEWPSAPYPGAKMPDFGCALEKLVISHPNTRVIAQRLAGHFTDKRISFQEADHLALTATIRTPSGLRSL